MITSAELSRDDAARKIEEIGFEDADEVAAALRGDMVPKEGAETLIAALRDQRIPRELKSDGGPIRTAIAAAWVAHNADQEERRARIAEQAEQAEEAFVQFRAELSELSRRMPGYATEQEIRRTSMSFFRSNYELPPLVKALEALIVACEPNEVSDYLRTDPQLASTVVAAPSGERGTALIKAMQDRAREAVQANFRRRCGGMFGRQDGECQALRDARNARRPVGKKSGKK